MRLVLVVKIIMVLPAACNLARSSMKMWASLLPRVFVGSLARMS